MTDRLTQRFAALKADNRCGFVAYMMAGDPDIATSWELLNQLPGAGVDVVELGFAFSDPTADGPSIQQAGQRALAAGIKLADVFTLAARFREAHLDTPLILMGYANPIHRMGFSAFADAAAEAGVDGVIVVDMPPEEDGEFRRALAMRDLDLIRLATPTSDSARLDVILEHARGFLYYVSVTGVTGGAAATAETVAHGLEPVRAKSDLPVAVGFGVREPEQAAALARYADAVVVGSAIVDALTSDGPGAALAVTQALADAAHSAR